MRSERVQLVHTLCNCGMRDQQFPVKNWAALLWGCEIGGVKRRIGVDN